MQIREIKEVSVKLSGGISNAVVNFDEHTVSLLAIVTDIIRNGKPVIGYAFNSIGRFAQSGILQDRLIPRVLTASPNEILDANGKYFDPAKVVAVAMKNEKPGGHGDRAGAMAALELAIWDVNAKLRDEPAYVTIARAFGHDAKSEPVPVYAAGGYYYPGDAAHVLTEEIKGYLDLGFTACKIKIGGLSLAEDMSRIEAALTILGGGKKLAVDANGRFNLETAKAYGTEISPLNLRWYEEIGDPLDFKLNAEMTQFYDGCIATGENIFSARDTSNLVQFAGMRPKLDVFQMDAGLSYGLTEYAQMIDILEAAGHDRSQAHPHGGHLINLHIVVGLGLGGCEAYPGVFQPFGGYAPQCKLQEGLVMPSDAPGFGLEQKEELTPHLKALADQ